METKQKRHDAHAMYWPSSGAGLKYFSQNKVINIKIKIFLLCSSCPEPWAFGPGGIARKSDVIKGLIRSTIKCVKEFEN